MPQPKVEYPAAGPVHDERQQDDGQDYHDHPEEEHDDAGDGIPGYSSRSSHGHQLPTAARLIRRVFRQSQMASHRQSRKPAGGFGSPGAARIAPSGRFRRRPPEGGMPSIAAAPAALAPPRSLAVEPALVLN